MPHFLRTVVSLAAAWLLLGCSPGSDSTPVPIPDEAVASPTIIIESQPPSTAAAADAPEPDDGATAPGGPRDTDAPAPTEPADPPDTAAPPATEAASNVVYLRAGDEGEAVGRMQSKLAVLEYLSGDYDSGVFDESTEQALRRFQSDYGLGVDGTFGPITGRSLNAAVQSVNTDG